MHATVNVAQNNAEPGGSHDDVTHRMARPFKRFGGRMPILLPALRKTIEFSFVDIAGSTQKGYMSHAVFTIIDANHHTGEMTYTLPGGKSYVYGTCLLLRIKTSRPS